MTKQSRSVVVLMLLCFKRSKTLWFSLRGFVSCKAMNHLCRCSFLFHNLTETVFTEDSKELLTYIVMSKDVPWSLNFVPLSSFSYDSFSFLNSTLRNQPSRRFRKKPGSNSCKYRKLCIRSLDCLEQFRL